MRCSYSPSCSFFLSFDFQRSPSTPTIPTHPKVSGKKRKKRKVDDCVQDSYQTAVIVADGVETRIFECKVCGKHFKLEQVTEMIEIVLICFRVSKPMCI